AAEKPLAAARCKSPACGVDERAIVSCSGAGVGTARVQGCSSANASAIAKASAPSAAAHTPRLRGVFPAHVGGLKSIYSLHGADPGPFSSTSPGAAGVLR